MYLTIFQDKFATKNVFEVFSADGTRHVCQFPRIKIPDHKNENPEKVESISEILSPLKDNCLIFGQGWWTYEFCYNKHVRQFHLGPKNIEADYILGVAQEENQVSETLHKLYYPVFYQEGDICNINNKRRTTEVRFYCSPSANRPSIKSITEPGSCNYQLEIETDLICKHHIYKPILNSVNQISCISLLETNDFVSTQIIESESSTQQSKTNSFLGFKPILIKNEQI